MSEGGLGVRAEISQALDLRQMNFSLPDSSEPIFCDAKVSWIDGHKGRAGIQFVDLPEEARERIKHWVSSKTDKPQEPANGEQAAMPADFSRPRRSEDAFNLDSFFPPESTLTFKCRTKPAVSGNSALDYAVSRWAERDDDSGKSLEETSDEEVVAESIETGAAAPAGFAGVAESVQFSDLSHLKTAAPNEDSVTASPLDIASGDAVNADVPVPLRAPMELPTTESKLPEARPREDWQVPFQVSARPSKEPWTSISPPTLPTAKKRSMAPVMTAAAGFALGLGLCAVVIIGPSRIIETGSNLLLQAEKVWDSKAEVTATADSGPRVASDAAPSENATNSRAGAAAAPAALPASVSRTSQPHVERESNDAGAANHRANGTLESTEPQTRADGVEAASAASVPRSQTSSSGNPPASAPVGNLPAPPMVAPVAKPTQPQPMPERNEPGVSSLTESATQKVPSGTVASSSQFAGVHISADSGSEKPQLSGVLQIGQVSMGAGPVYPIAAAQAHIEGTVVLHATIGTDGNVEKLEAVSGAPELITAAMTAVHNWHYVPTMIASKPVESEQTITFVFHLTD